MSDLEEERVLIKLREDVQETLLHANKDAKRHANILRIRAGSKKTEFCLCRPGSTNCCLLKDLGNR